MKSNKNSVVILVFNKNDEIALQLRAAHDDSYPLHWDFSAAGGIEPQEDHFTAAHRELKEEIGISGKIEFIGEDLYEDEQGTDRLYIYKLKHNGPFILQKEEVKDVKFFSHEEIQKMITTGEQFHPEFVYIWNKDIISQVGQ